MLKIELLHATFRFDLPRYNQTQTPVGECGKSLGDPAGALARPLGPPARRASVTEKAMAAAQPWGPGLSAALPFGRKRLRALRTLDQTGVRLTDRFPRFDELSRRVLERPENTPSNLS